MSEQSARRICGICKFVFRNDANPDMCFCRITGEDVKLDGYCDEFEEFVLDIFVSGSVQTELIKPVGNSGEKAE